MSRTLRSLRGRDRLLLGWAVDRMFEPRAWLADDPPDPEAVPDTDVCFLSPRALAAHSCVVARSGSGKSVFVGRLIEEILLATRANVIVLDPNADYRSFHSVIRNGEWSPARYDRASRLGKLPTERATSGFLSFMRSEAMSFRILSNHEAPAKLPQNVAYVPLRLEWGDLDASFFYDEHSTNEEKAHMTAAHEFALAMTKVRCHATHSEDITRRVSFSYKTNVKLLTPLVGLSEDRLTKLLMEGVKGAAELDAPIRHACELSQFVTKAMWRDYRQALAHLMFEGIVTQECTFAWSDSEPARVQVVDISSVSQAYQRRVAEVVLEGTLTRAKRRWSEALGKAPGDDKRVPTFVVLEEAQHLAPASAPQTSAILSGKVVREIAAEGRKYGLFLILVTQQAEKVDPMVLSEVENIAILGLNTPYALDKVSETFGLQHESRRLLESVLRFPKGRALLLGRWVEYSPQILYVAMRRTVEGGRNLTDERWAIPPVW